MARRHQPPMTPEQIQREIKNWNNVFESGLISKEELQVELVKLQRLLAKRERDEAAVKDRFLKMTRTALVERVAVQFQNGKATFAWDTHKPVDLSGFGFAVNPFEDDGQDALPKLQAVKRRMEQNLVVGELPKVHGNQDKAWVQFRGSVPHYGISVILQFEDLVDFVRATIFFDGKRESVRGTARDMVRMTDDLLSNPAIWGKSV